ncbi:MAG TPA: DUF2520 domain-containing protein, partial [Solirubrobacterales bacterium]|nr:DUF2520 domain-containing protein [Solirubrobacterales bacterium]
PLSATPLIVVGRGRLGRSLAAGADRAEIEVTLVSHEDVGSVPEGAGVLLCVPDDAIAETAERFAAADPSLIGHVSGATTLDALAPAGARGAGRFSLHPLQTFADGEAPVDGTPAAVAGSTDEALSFARALAEALGMRPFEVPEEKRAAYHAAAAMASNLLVALEESAAEVLTRIGMEDARELLAPLVLRTAANWVERGPAALTGPIARGDRATVQSHRVALAETAPELVRLYDVLVMRAEALAWKSVHGVPS